MEDSPSKPSVAELAGRFKGHILPTPLSSDEFRRKPPSSLKLRSRTDGDEEADKCSVFPAPSKIRSRNSAMIEKLQANLALSPTALLPSPRSPEVKLQPAPPAPAGPPTPLSPNRPLSSEEEEEEEEEEKVGFVSPPEGVLLPSINKTRARLSFKRRPPTRQHRRSAGDEAGAFGGRLSPTEPCSPKENGDDRELPLNKEEEEEEEEEDRREDVPEAGRSPDEDCEKTEAAEGGGDGVEAEAREEEELQPPGPTGQEEEEEEDEERGEERENDGM